MIPKPQDSTQSVEFIHHFTQTRSLSTSGTSLRKLFDSEFERFAEKPETPSNAALTLSNPSCCQPNEPKSRVLKIQKKKSTALYNVYPECTYGHLQQREGYEGIGGISKENIFGKKIRSKWL